MLTGLSGWEERVADEVEQIKGIQTFNKGRKSAVGYIDDRKTFSIFWSEFLPYSIAHTEKSSGPITILILTIHTNEFGEYEKDLVCELRAIYEADPREVQILLDEERIICRWGA